ncbi:MAG: 3-methyl-2-oxobutanoate hydroxymethyltransferase [Phycisphaerales bacterium]|nr:3-methyl-2-oxobutanoate hydroxymethyltransferase [Phycisphaerales bacterium]
MAATDNASNERISLRTIRKMMVEGRRFACLTCYDATTARWMERAGLPMLLVGDTLAEMVLGHDQTYYAGMDIMVALTAAVRRGAPNVMLMADMPFMSYQADDAEAMRNAARFMTQAGADLVKIEVDRSFAPLVEKMARAGIPVVAHIGSRPQQTKLSGGYRSVGRTPEEAMRLIADARALEAAGAVMLLIEATPAEVAHEIVQGSTIPVIGCGAGPSCHGQVIVLHDLLGLTDWQPKFAPPVADFGHELVKAVKTWMDKVDRNDLGEHPYQMVKPEGHDAAPRRPPTPAAR